MNFFAPKDQSSRPDHIANTKFYCLLYLLLSQCQFCSTSFCSFASLWPPAIRLMAHRVGHSILLQLRQWLMSYRSKPSTQRSHVAHMYGIEILGSPSSDAFAIRDSASSLWGIHHVILASVRTSNRLSNLQPSRRDSNHRIAPLKLPWLAAYRRFTVGFQAIQGEVYMAPERVPFQYNGFGKNFIIIQMLPSSVSAPWSTVLPPAIALYYLNSLKYAIHRLGQK